MNLKGLCLFGEDVVRLVSMGKKESVSIIEEKAEQGCLVEYICRKYQGSLLIDIEDVYNTIDLNRYFLDVCVHGDASRKYGIVSEEEGGLLLVLSMILNKAELWAGTAN